MVKETHYKFYFHIKIKTRMTSGSKYVLLHVLRRLYWKLSTEWDIKTRCTCFINDKWKVRTCETITNLNQRAAIRAKYNIIRNNTWSKTTVSCLSPSFHFALRLWGKNGQRNWLEISRFEHNRNRHKKKGSLTSIGTVNNKMNDCNHPLSSSSIKMTVYLLRYLLR